MTPGEWGRVQAALAPPWSDETWRLVLATLGLASTARTDEPVISLLAREGRGNVGE